MTRRLALLLAVLAALAAAAACGEDEVAVPPAAERLSGFGIAATLPEGWDGRVFRSASSGNGVLQAANMELPPADETDFGFNVVARIPPEGVYVALLDLGMDSRFPDAGVPTAIRAADLRPSAAPGPFPDRAGGVQRFFTEAGRGWALYVVAGEREGADAGLAPVNELLASVELGPAP